MSGGIQPICTNVNPIPLWTGAGGGGSSVSSFSVLSASTITASTITTGNLSASGKIGGVSVTAPNGFFAVDQVGLLYSSTLTGTAPTNASTLLNSFTEPGLYALNLNCTTTAVNGFGMGGSFVVGENQTTPGYLYGFPVGFTTNGPYSIQVAPAQDTPGTGGIDVFLANNAGAVNLPYNGTFTRLGF